MLLGGELILQLFNVLLLTLVIAPLVLWRYRQAVLSGTGVGAAALPVPHAPALADEPPADRDAAQRQRLAWERRLRRRVLASAWLATLPPALLLAVLKLYLDGHSLTPAHVWFTASVYCIAAVPVFAVLTALPLRRALLPGAGVVLALAFGSLAVTMLQRAVQGRMPSADQLLNVVYFFQLAAITLGLPLLLGLAIGARRVRGVAPLTFAALLVFALGPLLGLRITHWLSGTSAGTEWILLGPGVETGFVLLALPVGLLAWQRLKAIARAYEDKRFSDAQLLAHTWWLLVVADEAVQLINVHPGTGTLMLIVAGSGLTYASFPPLLAFGLRRAHAAEPRPRPRLLLLLRVFGDTARTEALFDRTALRWQLFGPVAMIAAPDVIARTVDPGDILRFALGHLDSSFVTTPEDLQRRIAALDRKPDPDGRYRMTEFCCRDSSWQATVVTLMKEADAVLMDLRGFNPQRAGCEYELRELRSRIDPARVVLVVDDSTDRGFLEPLLGAGDARMSVIDYRRAGRDETFKTLLRAAG